MKFILFLTTALFTHSVILCQTRSTEQSFGPEKISRILFVLDASNSMYGRWENGTKMEVAQRLMTEMIDSLSDVDNPNFELALRVYGHQKPVPPQDCNDTKLEVAFGPNNLSRIKQKIRELRPLGTTPIARSILSSGGDFPKCENCRNIIVLITDGVEACEEDPCAASKILQKRGITLKPFVIGIGLDPELVKSFDCVGSYYDAKNEVAFKKVLGVIVTQVLDNTTAQVNLIDNQGLASESNLPVILRNAESDLVEKLFIHTLNYKNLPDTLSLDPLIQYNGLVYSIPPVAIDSTYIYAGKHNQVGTRVIMGQLNLSIPGAKPSQTKPIALIRRPGETQILNVQVFNTSNRYLSGIYELDILTLPRYNEKIEIKPGGIHDFSIPAPGDVTIQLKTNGYGAIFEIDGEKLTWVTNLDDKLTRQRYAIQPGQYMLVFRSGSSQQTSYSKTQKFNVSSGTSTLVRL